MVRDLSSYTMVIAFLAVGAACSSNGDDSTTTGGAPQAGGLPGEASGGGGTTESGGVPGTGGQPTTGGASAAGGLIGTGAAGSGGVPLTGGQPATGGISATGGVPTGGQPLTGGVPATGGAVTGGATTGGAAPTGGAMPETGGATTPGGTGGAAGSLATGGGGGDVQPSPGCGKTPTLPTSVPPPNTQMNYIDITSGGQSRRYLLWYPDNYDNTHPYRLVIAYHWWSGSASQVFDCSTEGINCYTTQSPFYGLLNLADDSTIFVAPDGTGDPLGWPNGDGAQLVFTDDILEQVESDLCIDKTRIFANGFSYGGGMSYAIACDRADVFRAVAVYSGAVLSGCGDGTKPIAYFASHGQDDGTCSIDGGRQMRDHFAQVNGCTAQQPPEPADGSNTHICTSFEGCSAGHPVRWCEFDGSNGHDPSPRDPGQSETWNPGEVWDFFTQF